MGVEHVVRVEPAGHAAVKAVDAAAPDGTPHDLGRVDIREGDRDARWPAVYDGTACAGHHGALGVQPGRKDREKRAGLFPRDETGGAARGTISLVDSAERVVAANEQPPPMMLAAIAGRTSKSALTGQPPAANGSDCFSACEQNHESIHCLAMPGKTHRGDAPIARISCCLGTILGVNSIT